MLPRWEERHRDFDALPERLARAGYSTAVVTDYGGDLFSAIDLGFQSVEAPRMTFDEVIRQKAFGLATPLLPFLHTRAGRSVFPSMLGIGDAADAGMLASTARSRLRTLAAARRPFLLNVFFSATHFPYAAPYPYYAKRTSPDYGGLYKYDKHEWVSAGEAPTPEDVTQLRALYDGAAASVDDAAGTILDELGALGLAESTIIVVLSDHGEELMEAGRWIGHGDHLFGDRQNHIPLAIVDPRTAVGRREPAMVRDVDLAPTLYELTGITPPFDLDGTSLVAAPAEPPVAAKLAFGETELWLGKQPGLPDDLRFPFPPLVDFGEIDTVHDDAIVVKANLEPLMLVVRHRMVKDQRWKLVYVPLPGGPKYLLFDEDADPDDLHDVAAEHPVERARLEAELWPWMLGDTTMERRGGLLAPKGVTVPGVDGPLGDAP
jgi:arylsulfatase A-like enzyme